MEEETNKQKNEVDLNEEMPQEFLDYFNSQPEYYSEAESWI